MSEVGAVGLVLVLIAAVMAMGMHYYAELNPKSWRNELPVEVIAGVLFWLGVALLAASVVGK